MCIDGIMSEILIHMSTSITLEDLHTHCQHSGWFLCFIWWCWHWRKLVTNYSSQLTRRLCDTEAQPNWGVCKGHHCSNYRKEPQVAETRNLGQNKLYDSKDDHVWNIGDMAVCHSSSGMKAIRSCNSPADIQTRFCDYRQDYRTLGEHDTHDQFTQKLTCEQYLQPAVSLNLIAWLGTIQLSVSSFELGHYLTLVLRVLAVRFITTAIWSVITM